jgi:hypothetical protein
MRNRFFPETFKRLSSFWIFPIVLLLIAWIYNFDHILFLGPQSLHFWRQTDCLSFTQNFMMENRGLFHPSINYIGVRGDGEVASDFPLIYYLVGKLWQLFGQHEWIYRLLVFILFTSALVVVYNTLRNFLNDNVWAGFISLLLFTSPVLAYYSCNFLVNLPAFSFAMFGLSGFYYFYKTGKNVFLWLSCLAYLLGGLIKIPSLMSFVVICFIYVTEVFGIIKYRVDRKIFSSKLLQLIPLLIIVFAEVFWILYLNKYNKDNGGLFLVGIYPIWGLSKVEIKNIVDVFFNFWFTQHLSRALHYISLGMLLWIIVNLKRIKPILRAFIILCFVGVCLYIILWFQALLNHDYYVTNTYIYFLIVWAVAIKIFIDRFPKVTKSIWAKLVFSAFLIYNVWYCEKEINQRYNGWKNDFYKKSYQGLIDLKPELRKIGITRLDTVIVMGDETINGSLYLLDQKGWTNYGGFLNNKDSIMIERAIKSGAKYMILLDSGWVQKDFVKPFLYHQILQKDEYKVFQLK